MITFHDNNYTTVDRYSMTVQEGTLYHCYSFSGDCASPQGVNSFNGTYSKEELNTEAMGQSIDFASLPYQVQMACLQRLDPNS